MPFTSKQKGRMSALLKAKSKVGIVPRERKTYEPYDILKKFRANDGSVIEIPAKLSQAQGNQKQTSDGKKIQPTLLEKYDTEMKK